MTRTAAARPGLTLLEAMIAIGVMAVGLLSLLTLFPLGAFQIGQALKDDRCTQCALQADGTVRVYWQTRVVESNIVTGQPRPDTDLVARLDDPDGPSPPGAVFAPIADPATQMGYPLLLDPIGFASRGGNPTQGSVLDGVVGRTSLKMDPPATTNMNLDTAYRVCTLLDDLTFNPNGRAGNGVDAGAVVTRAGRYNWSALVQRPAGGAGTANLQILVYDQRPAGILEADAEKQATIVTPLPLAAGVTTVRVSGLTRTDPNAPGYVKKGGWFMDATVNGTERHADFYRVVGVNDLGGGQYQLDFDPPLRKTIPAAGAGIAPAVVFFAGLAEVYQRPLLKDLRTP